MRLGFFILTILAVVCTHTTQAQYKQLVKDGNKLYQQKKYKEAAAEYQKALQKNPNYTPGAFNLGNALYQQKQYDGTRKVMEQVTKIDTSRAGKAAANYNIGNAYMAEQKWEEAIDAYKKTLRTNPQDADAKYNLSYAQQMLKKNGGGGKNNKDNKDNKDDKNKDNKDNKDDKNKDQQNKDNKDNKDDKNKDNKDQQDQNKDNKDDKKDEQDKRPQPQQSKMSEKQAEQLLNALQQEEKKLQDKHKKAAGTPVKVEKDW